MSGVLQVVAGGQYGSEAKGRVAAHLCRPEEDPERMVYCVRVGGSNAGHTVYGHCSPNCWEHGRSGDVVPGVVVSFESHPWRLRHVPVAAVVNPDAKLVLAAGSEIDPDVLGREVVELESAGYKVRDRLYVDPQATVVEQRHIEAETGGRRHGEAGLTHDIGSTGKGIGAARADRAMRRAALVGDWTAASHLLGTTADTATLLRDALRDEHAQVVIEGVQGYGLGTHAGYYPKVTSSDCRAIDFLAMAGLSPWDPVVGAFEPWLVLRTRPIRVAGDSGPMRAETSWSQLGLPDEYTSVTNKVRRVGGWDWELASRAVEANGGAACRLALTMLDQVWPESAGATAWDRLPRVAQTWVRHVEQVLGAPVLLLGTGPHTLVDLR